MLQIFMLNSWLLVALFCAPAQAQWAWLGGGSALGISGFYGTRGVSSPWNFPGGRQHHRMVAHPSDNTSILLLGGQVYESIDGRAFVIS
jgi:hypothetical protein